MVKLEEHSGKIISYRETSNILSQIDFFFYIKILIYNITQ